MEQCINESIKNSMANKLKQFYLKIGELMNEYQFAKILTINDSYLWL